MAKQIIGNLNIENAKIGFKNFIGAEGPYNDAGDRNFSVFLDPEYAKELEAIGWNVKWPKAKVLDEGEIDERQPHLPVKLTFNNYPPKIILVAGEHTTQVGEDEMEALQYSNIINADLVIRPFQYDFLGKQGIKAYCKALYVTIETDAFADKYRL